MSDCEVIFNVTVISSRGAHRGQELEVGLRSYFEVDIFGETRGEGAARDQAVHLVGRDQAAHHPAARDHEPEDPDAHDQDANDQAANDQAAHDPAAHDPAAHDPAARDQANHGQATRDLASDKWVVVCTAIHTLLKEVSLISVKMLSLEANSNWPVKFSMLSI